MEFPLIGVIEVNSSDSAADLHGESLYSRMPAITALYVAVLGVAVVVGTLGNVAVVTNLAVNHIRRRQRRVKTTGNSAGWAFIANLALSDMIVTAVINPLAIAGQYINCVTSHSDQHCIAYIQNNECY